jgi:alcohol dehydrogenase class IV
LRFEHQTLTQRVVFGAGAARTQLAGEVAALGGRRVLLVVAQSAGSEATPVWGRTESHRKTTGTDSRVLPRTIVYDPELSVSLPVDFSIASGLNALAHCVDSSGGRG